MSSRREGSAAPAHPGRGPGAVLALQRTAGNRAVRQLLGTPGAVTVQRASLNIRPDGTISGVSQFPSRPPSNLSKQGQHLTAYVAFEDTILSNVRDRTPSAAAEQLIWVARQFQALPFMETVNQWNRHVHQSIEAIIATLRDALDRDPPDDKFLRSTVGRQIDELLRERNRVPHTAISESGTKGHGEAATAGGLEVMETAIRTRRAGAYGDDEATQAVTQMWQLLDYDPAEPSAASPELLLIQRRVLTHVRSMRLAYPQVFAWLTGLGAGYWLMPYLRAHQDKFSSLSRLSAPRLLDVETYVHANL
ncbi:hypothetical protein QQG74_13315 [Micromonospora sp. FIMYZ51]|uniref:hypothetical protein n=1 Tax=Micromonospora sp. FIMYZ51 TaxID=3051832 RepID=UPI0031203740